jgi:DNA-binding NtrC family response regulator
VGEARPSAPLLVAFPGEGFEAEAIAEVAEEFGWRLQIGTRPEEEWENGGGLTVVLFDRDFGGGDWRAALRRFKDWPARPHVILISRSSDLNLWDELARVGGSDIVKVPVERESLVWSLHRALVLHRCRREVRVSRQRPV